jgi:hypothetical protein
MNKPTQGVTFAANECDSLMEQLKANGVDSVQIELNEHGAFKLVFVAESGREYWLVAPTVAEALYDACCINEHSGEEGFSFIHEERTR